ncbi:MAG: hypothetical protein ACMUIA_05310 [bacterium]
MRQGTTATGEKIGHGNIPWLNGFLEDKLLEKIILPGKFYRAAESLPAFRSALEEVPWTPDLIFIFSGYDSHQDDCGRGVTNWTNQDYKALTKCVVEMARRAKSPILSVHGGGYKLPVTISAAVSHVEVLAETG